METNLVNELIDQRNDLDNEKQVNETSPQVGKSRYGRTHKPKLSNDFCNIDDVIIENKKQLSKSPVKSSPNKKSPNKVIKSTIKTVEKSQKNLELSKSNIEKDIEIESEDNVKNLTDNEAFTSDMWDSTILKLQSNFYKTVRSPNNTNKQRKFFKSTTESNNCVNSLKNETDISVDEDMTKILKIVTNKTLDSSESSDVKSVSKLSLKTYGNKRKLHRSDVVESFGLPDEPIIPTDDIIKNIPTDEIKEVLDIDLKVTENGNLWDKKLIDKPFMNEKDIQKNFVENTLKNSNSVVFDFPCDIAKETDVQISNLDKTIESNVLEVKEKQNNISEKAVKIKKQLIQKKTKKRSNVPSLLKKVPKRRKTSVDSEDSGNTSTRVLRSHGHSPAVLKVPKKASPKKINQIRSCSVVIVRSKMNVADQVKFSDKLENVTTEISASNNTEEQVNNVNDTLECNPEKEIEEDSDKLEGVTSETSIGNNTEEQVDNLNDILNSSPEKEIEKENDIMKSEIALHNSEEQNDMNNTCDISLDENESKNFQVGNIVWGQIGSHPYWPCMITTEPGTEVFEKYINKKGTLKAYHVRFFGDSGRRSWILAIHCLPFTSANDLNILLEKIKSKRKVKSTNPYVVRPPKLSKWKIGVEEAELLLNKTYKEKLNFFSNLFSNKKQVKKIRIPKVVHDKDSSNITSDVVSTEENVSLNKDDESIVNNVENEKDISINKQVKKEKKNENSITSTPESIEDSIKNVVNEEDEEPQVSNYEAKSTSIIDNIESQAELYKRNNLFRGISKRRVCQICEKDKDVFKCRGPCLGYYHKHCAFNLNDKNIENNNETSDEASNSEVEIVSVKSVKNFSLPALTLSPRLKDVPLVDQIDLKMEEVMHEQMDKTIYADSTTDYSSSDESPVKKVLKIQHVTADHITYLNVPENDSTIDKKIVKPSKDVKIDNIEVSSVTSTERDEFKCQNCILDVEPPCFICGCEISKTDSNIRQKCSLYVCGKFYHPECLKTWPQTQWSLISTTKHRKSDKIFDTFVCPLHVCHTCVSDNPCGTRSRCSSDNAKCLRCPATYHTTSFCIPAGTVILSSSQVICPRHLKNKQNRNRGLRTINTTWCFICSKGGALICCDTCPTSVHATCLNIEIKDDDHFICEDCESGRFPLYDEIVWVKLGAYRWWPAVILFPNEVPKNVQSLAHEEGEFVVKFFGTYDHYWVGRGRVFLFQEGDKGHKTSVRRKVDSVFNKAVEEASKVYKLKRDFKNSKQEELKSDLKPPPYIRIKVNKPVGNVRLFDGNVSNTTSCDCDPNQPFPCGPDSYCLNRLLLTECNPDVCPAGNKCNNRQFEKREYPLLLPYKTQNSGWGLKNLKPIPKGQFIIEYVGEVINEKEYLRRIKKMHEQKEENYYFLTIDKDRTIDAGPKGNLARFMNHSCQPNCETQKWTVNGYTRVGLFAKEDIPESTELTFNYNLECIGKEKKICKCGAPNCSGFIGVKAKSEESQKKPKKIVVKLKSKKQSTPTPQVITNNSNEICFICGQNGDVRRCDSKICTKSYHLQCINLTNWPKDKWTCSWHQCNLCTKRTIRCCIYCINSYCPSHAKNNIRHDKLLGFLCSEHDTVQTNENTKETSPIVTEEADVTSTTSDELVQDTLIQEECNSQNSDEKDSENIVEETKEQSPLQQESGPSDVIEKDVQLDEVKNNLSDESKTTKKRKKGNTRNKLKSNKKIKLNNTNPLKSTNTATTLIDISKEVKLSSSVPIRHLRKAKILAQASMSEREERFFKRQREYEKDLPIRKRTRPRCETTL